MAAVFLSSFDFFVLRRKLAVKDKIYKLGSEKMKHFAPPW